jgi:excisionase family DNA binding protein
MSNGEQGVAEMGSYMTTQDVADRLGVSVFTIRRYIRAGKLKAVRLDAGYRVSRQDIADFLKAHEIAVEPGLSGAAAPSPPARPVANGV